MPDFLGLLCFLQHGLLLVCYSWDYYVVLEKAKRVDASSLDSTNQRKYPGLRSHAHSAI